MRSIIKIAILSSHKKKETKSRYRYTLEIDSISEKEIKAQMFGEKENESFETLLQKIED